VHRPSVITVGGKSLSSCAYLFLDEAGNFDFSAKGTRYFVLSSVSVRRPFVAHALLDDYKHDCLEFGLNTEYFHCAEDNVHVRSRVFELIARHLDQFCVDSLIVDKPKTGPALRQDHRFYPEMLGHLLKYVLPKALAKEAEEVIVITDAIPLQKKRKVIEKAIQKSLTMMLPIGVKYRILHHASRSHFGLQIADYFNWAVFRKWERGDVTAFNKVRAAIRSEFDIFRKGNRYYYDWEK
jgi:hypothetical protein